MSASQWIDVFHRLGQAVRDVCSDDIEATAEIGPECLHIWLMNVDTNICHEVQFDWEQLVRCDPREFDGTMRANLAFALLQLKTQTHQGSYRAN